MSNVIRLKKGLDIKLVGQAAKKTIQLPLAETYALSPTDYIGVTPKMLVKEGDIVLAGSPVFFSKENPDLIFTSPVSGKILEVVRGDKRKILGITISPDTNQEYKKFEIASDLNKESATALLLESGLWPSIIQRPYGIIANPKDTPRDIFISGFDTAPLGVDVDYAITAANLEFVEYAVEVLKKMTSGKVHLSLNSAGEKGILDKVKGVEKHHFEGPHPAGNVGVQIHHIKPVSKGEVVWTVAPQDLVAIGKFFKTGKVDMSKTIALCGSGVTEPVYAKVITGASLKSIFDGRLKDGDYRIIAGNVLTGETNCMDCYLNYYASQFTVIPEGNHYEFMGWAAPRLKKFSVSRSYFSWLCKNKSYDLDTNMNGGERAMVMTGLYEQYLPMDIYPMYLIKAILAQDIEKMENLGIYEIIEEDIALCEFVCPSKTELQEILRGGISLMVKELN